MKNPTDQKDCLQDFFMCLFLSVLFPILTGCTPCFFLKAPDKILGISAGTVEEAQAAEKAGADYIGVGAVFGTSTKKNARNLSTEKLKEISSSVSIPVVAIGGINASNVEELSGCGVDGVAVVSAIFAAEDPGAATEHLKTLAAEMVSHE